MRRLTAFLVAGVIVTTALLLVSSGVAVADSINPICASSSCSVGVAVPGSSGGVVSSVQPVSAVRPGGSSSGPCRSGETVSYVRETSGGRAVTSEPGDVNPLTGAPVASGSSLEDVYCNGVLLTVLVIPTGGAAGAAAPTVTGAQLATRAVSRFRVKAPMPMLSPARAVVNYPTWLWLSGGWSAQSATATVPGLSATVTARPVRVVWDMGDGGRVVCSGPGVPYRPAVADSAQHTDCSYAYARSSAGFPGGSFTATVTVYLRAAWTATDGTAGQLGTVTGVTHFLVVVEQIEAVNT